MAAKKKPKKKYVPRPVYYPGLIVQIHAFENFENALNMFLETEEVETDSTGLFIYYDNAGIKQSFESSLRVYITLANIYGERNNLQFNLHPLTILQNRMFERRGFDEEEIEEAKKALDICKQIICKIPAREIRNILDSVKAKVNIDRVVVGDLKNPEILLSSCKFNYGDLSYEEVINKDEEFQKLYSENPNDERIKYLRDVYMKFLSAYRFTRRNECLQNT